MKRNKELINIFVGVIVLFVLGGVAINGIAIIQGFELASCDTIAARSDTLIARSYNGMFTASSIELKTAYTTVHEASIELSERIIDNSKISFYDRIIYTRLVGELNDLGYASRVTVAFGDVQSRISEHAASNN
jgi:hypothetical protein